MIFVVFTVLIGMKTKTKQNKINGTQLRGLELIDSACLID